jgi:hypothetical protein
MAMVVTTEMEMMMMATIRVIVAMMKMLMN